MQRLKEIVKLFVTRGHDAYLGEDVSQAEHALQAAWLADRDGASDALVVAALLHDFGHLIHDQGDDVADRGIDARHEEVGAAWLLKEFGPEVAEPARLHVEAKRYLCAVEQAYLEGLSTASKQSLELQGGPMSPEEAERFRANPYHSDAIRLRRWDDRAKVPDLNVPLLDAYLDRLVEALKDVQPLSSKGSDQVVPG